jgi:hypothetical protein
MDITYSQKTGIKLTGKGLSVALDPTVETKSDVVLLSRLADFERSLTTFDGPGEYEVKGCMIDALALPDGLTAYRVELEDMRLGYLPVFPEEGDKGSDPLRGCDVLFVPLGGVKVEVVAKLVASFEPKIVVPTNYSEQELTAFLSEMGAKDVEPIERLKLQRKDIAEDRQQVVVLQS